MFQINLWSIESIVILGQARIAARINEHRQSIIMNGPLEYACSNCAIKSY